jgi:hypothetical protein
MRKVVRYSARALAAVLAIGAAYAARPSVGNFGAALGRAPIVAWIDEAPAMPKAASRAEARPTVDGAAFAALNGERANCLAGGCAGGPTIKSSDPCEPCLGLPEPSLPYFARSGLDEAPSALIEPGFEGAGEALRGDLGPVYLAGFEPIASAAPTPEISTAAMLTLGFAGIVRAARRARRNRRTALMNARQVCPC